MRKTPVVKFRWLVLLSALALIGAACGGDSTTETTASSGSPTPLLPGQDLTLTGVTEASAFVEDVTADGLSVLLEGGGEVSVTFNSSGGPVTGMFTETLTGEDPDGNTYTVSYTGVLSGDYDPVLGLFDGTVSLSGDVPPGFEAALPSDSTWDGGVLVGPDACDEIGECMYGATKPDVDVIWDIDLPSAAVNPAFVANLG